jgi:hypothetical protein
MVFEKILAILTEIYVSDNERASRRFAIGCGALVVGLIVLCCVLMAL